jgi:hypothetical protein
MDRTSLRQRLAAVEAKITGVQHQIGEQRQVIVKLETAGCPADHAKYLLAGLELLQAAYRDRRTAMLGELVQPGRAAVDGSAMLTAPHAAAALAGLEKEPCSLPMVTCETL